MSSKYRISDHQDVHFICFAVVHRVDALSRNAYKDSVIDSLRFCQQRKVKLFAYVIMSNHVRLIACAEEGFNLPDILRDLKRHTSKALLYAIQNNPTESRKDRMLWILKSTGKNNVKNKEFQFLATGNRSIQLSTSEPADSD